MPYTFIPLLMALRTTARMAAFMPGASPPLVMTAMVCKWLCEFDIIDWFPVSIIDAITARARECNEMQPRSNVASWLRWRLIAFAMFELDA
jgi:hypothetical protein